MNKHPLEKKGRSWGFVRGQDMCTWHSPQVPPESPDMTQPALPTPRTQWSHGDAAGFPAEVTARAPRGWGVQKSADRTMMAWMPLGDFWGTEQWPPNRNQLKRKRWLMFANVSDFPGAAGGRSPTEPQVQAFCFLPAPSLSAHLLGRVHFQTALSSWGQEGCSGFQLEPGWHLSPPSASCEMAAANGPVGAPDATAGFQRPWEGGSVHAGRLWGA